MNNWCLDENEIKCLKILDEMPEIFNQNNYEFFKIFFNDKNNIYKSSDNIIEFLNTSDKFVSCILIYVFKFNFIE